MNWSPPPLEVRWYWFRTAETANGLADIPAVVPHRGSVLRFCDADNRAIEQAYKQRADEYERCWWEEEASVSCKRPSSPPKSGGDDAKTKTTTTTAQTATQEGAEPDTSPSWRDFMVMKAGEEVGVPVRSGQWEVDLRTRKLTACYWPGPAHRVMRGMWFVEKAGEWLPLREPVSEQLEEAFTSQVWHHSKGMLVPQPDGPPAARIEIHTTTTQAESKNVEMYALFVTQNEVYLVRDGGKGWIRRSTAITRMKVRRGYVEPEVQAILAKEADLSAEAVDNAAAATPPSHLLLVVHGIGQNLAGANIGQDAQNLATGLRAVEKDAMAAATLAATSPGLIQDPSALPRPSDHTRVASPPRTEVLPVQWRKTLSLEVDALAAMLRPPGIPALRHVLHSTAVEVLLYLTPLHRAAILGGLLTALNSVYARFMLRNPEFKGSISIAAHSLGSVLCWDILCNQPSHAFGLQSREEGGVPRQQQHAQWDAWASSTAQGIGELEFRVDQLILLGSPLGCFLALRGVDQTKGCGLGTYASAPLMWTDPRGGSGTPDGLPAVRRLYHLYHPFDPVAYRLEPLAYSAQQLSNHQKWALVPLATGGKRLHIAAQEFGDSMSNAASWLAETLTFAGSRKASSPPLSPKLDAKKKKVAKHGDQKHKKALEQDHEEAEGEGEESGNLEFGQPDTESAHIWQGDTPPEGVSTIHRVSGGELPGSGTGPRTWPSSGTGRLDFAIQEASLENQYLSALSAHFVYWTSPDVALFIHRAVNGLDVISGKPQVLSSSDHSKR